MKNDQIKKVEDDIYMNILSQVMDPEIEIDIINLGLVYDITFDGKQTVEILMTLSTPNCPLSDAIVQDVKESIKSKYPDYETQVELTFEPLWSADMISPEGRKTLGM